MICPSGGAQCLEDYINGFLEGLSTTVDYKQFTYTVGGETHTYTINGEIVTDDEDNLICETGGENCLDDYIDNLMAATSDLVS